MNLPLRSLRWRLQLWHALISLLLIVAVCLLADRLVSRDRADAIDRELQEFERSFFLHGILNNRAEPGEPPARDEILTALRTFPESREVLPSFQHLFQEDSTQTYLMFWDKDGKAIYLSRNAPEGFQFPSNPNQFKRKQSVTEGSHRRIYHFHPANIFVVVGRDISEEQRNLTRFRLLLTLGGGAIFLSALAGGWWLAGRALVPIDSISQTASRIAGGNLDERIKVKEDDSELNRLAGVLNGTFDKLADSIERQKRFTADASHELRTPLTIILSETQRGLRRERDPESYRVILENCNLAAQRMRRLVESLLLLAREDTTRGNPENLDLAEIAVDSLNQLAPLAESHQSTITLETSPARTSANPSDIETLAHTLLSNAIAHTPPGTSVVLRTYAEDNSAILQVQDDGPGIPAEHIPHLFDRFYQVDKARSQSQNHSGLGLSIARSIARNYNGTVSIESSADSGTITTLRLPLVPAVDRNH